MNDQVKESSEMKKTASSHSEVVAPKDSSSDAALSGRELDAAVAERVMGLEVRWFWPGEERKNQHPVTPTGRKSYDGKGTEWDHIKHYSTDIAAAMRVIEKMRERGYGWTIVTHRDGWFVRCFELPDEGLRWRHNSHVNKSLAHTICETALAALDETEEAARLCGTDVDEYKARLATVAST